MSFQNKAAFKSENSASSVHSSHEEARNSYTERQTMILQAARSVLINHGYGKFSMRQVANCAGIHLKTLQHHFGSKKMLLADTMNYTLDEHYLAIYEEIDGGTSSRAPAEALSWVLRFLIEDCKKAETSLFFVDIWALAARDADACEALDSFYVRHRHLLANLISHANPSLAEGEVQLRAALIAQQIEGLVLFIGYNKPVHPEMNGIEEEAHKRLMGYAMSG